jgi:phage head maturation protease
MQKEIKLSQIFNFIKDTDMPMNSVIERKAFSQQIAIQPDEERTILAKISCISDDHDGDIVIPSGVDTTQYERNNIILWDHTYSQPSIGKMVALQKTSDSIYGKIQFADTDFAKDIFKLCKGGWLKACSIGFIIKSVLIRGTKEFNSYVREHSLTITDNVKRIITECTLMENSMTNIGCNNDALALAVSSKSILLNDITIKNLGYKLGEIILAKDNTPIEPKVEPVATEQVITETPIESKVEPIVAEPVTPKIESVEPVTPVTPIVEPVKVIVEPIVAEPVTPIVEPVKVETPKVQWNIVRNGDYLTSDKDLEIAKSIKKGKVL